MTMTNTDRAQMMLDKAMDLRNTIKGFEGMYPTTCGELMKYVDILEDEADRLMTEDQDEDWKNFIRNK